jgi:15-cis-phytoene synthase
MQADFEHCAALVRDADRDRYLATLFAPERLRGALFALYAFAVEIGRVRDVAREPIPGEIRLQWWHEALSGERDGEAAANPVAAALLTTIKRHRLAADKLTDLIAARRFDLYDEPMGTVADLEAYLRRTSSALIDLAAQILGGDAAAAAEPVGIAYGITGAMRTLPLHAAQHRLYLPLELLKRHAVAPHEIFAGHASPGLSAALAELRGLARRHLAAADERLPALPRQALPAFLPLAVVRPSLDRLERDDAFAPTEISPWRRQWLIWRAARNPARIAA